MTIDPKQPKENTDSDDEGENTSDAVPNTVNLQKRKADVEATRYGDWELNGRCIDF